MPPLIERISGILGVDLVELRDVGAQHGYRHVTGLLADGRRVFAKVAPEPAEAVAEAVAAEANGLRWLAAADGGPPVPQVIGVAGDLLVIALLAPLEQASAATGRRFGADLAKMHAAGAPSFGAPWPGYIASLPLDNHAAETDWGSWYAERRLVPYLRRAHDGGALSRADVGLVETVMRRIGELAGPPEPPSRLHGDLWSGNVLWSGGRGCLIDPAAHGGHRETDLAMMALFEPPELEAILNAYDEVHPLADDWRERVALHQLHPLLAHAAMFGGSYGSQAAGAARQYL